MQEVGSFNLAEAIEVLERTPKILNTLLREINEKWIFANEGKDTWNAFDVVGHLIHGEKTDWISRTKIIVSNRENKTFTPFDRFAQFENSKGKTLIQLLETFQELRQKNINTLKSFALNAEDFLKKGMHPELGEVTLKELLATWVAHDLGHIAQITRVMAKRYKNEVGPWTAYIPILK